MCEGNGRFPVIHFFGSFYHACCNHKTGAMSLLLLRFTAYQQPKAPNWFNRSVGIGAQSSWYQATSSSSPNAFYPYRSWQPNFQYFCWYCYLEFFLMDSPKINENLSQMQNFCDWFWIANEIPLCSRISVGIRRSRSSDSSIISWLCQSQLKAHYLPGSQYFP